MRGTKKIDWLNHFLEFIVVVIGILLAFQLNTCREDKKEQALVSSHAENVLEETLFNQKQIQAGMNTSEMLLHKLDSLITITSKESFSIEQAHILSMELMALDYLYIKKNAYNSMVETGDIRFMTNTQMQTDIISLYEYYKWLEGVDMSTRTAYLNNYLPYATENFDLVTSKPQAATIYSNKLFRNYLSVYQYSLRFRLQKQKDLLVVVNNFLEDNTP
ncbi:hypothetical protein G5B37_09235 [Rasiella rasia]|uniref:Uncharacterized protein n=1 Tax=Rasiella rasia TaxID=2744027 RepID=A0A6G6GMC2_9FLAO|nr:hypothetical protein [Rasiella rasia]QIE59736.1 hypothetical protein G5B37_09235 [Rasiella rasia]